MRPPCIKLLVADLGEVLQGLNLWLSSQRDRGGKVASGRSTELQDGQKIWGGSSAWPEEGWASKDWVAGAMKVAGKVTPLLLSSAWMRTTDERQNRGGDASHHLLFLRVMRLIFPSWKSGGSWSSQANIVGIGRSAHSVYFRPDLSQNSQLDLTSSGPVTVGWPIWRQSRMGIGSSEAPSDLTRWIARSDGNACQNGVRGPRWLSYTVN
jgi:hypothetical protein